MSDDVLRQMSLEALDAAVTTSGELARDAGLAPVTLTTWRSGRRTPTPDSAERIATILLVRARKIEHLAQRLMQHAKAGTRPEAGDLVSESPIDLFEE
jgi:transcriptional regulator with XRE-family HTH domain